MTSVLQKVKRLEPIRKQDWRIQAIDLIETQYEPKLLEIADAKWSKHELIRFVYDSQVYYAIFYMDKDGYFQNDIDSFHYNWSDGQDTFVTTDQSEAETQMTQIKARQNW